MPPYRANLGGMFGSGVQGRPGGNIDIASAVTAIGNQASSLIQSAYLRKIAQQERAAREAQMAMQVEDRRVAAEERRLAAAQRAEQDRINRFTTQLAQEKTLREMGYVPEAEVVPTPDVRAPGTLGVVPTGAMVDAARLGDVRETPFGGRFRLDRLRTPDARTAKAQQDKARETEVARAQRVTDREDEQAFQARIEQMRAARSRTTTAPGGGRASLPTEGERKAASLYNVAAEANATLDQLLGKGREVPSWLAQQTARLGRGTGNVLTSDQMRQMQQAAGIVRDAWLRYTSGAAVPESEVERFNQSFIPQAGDDRQTLERKRKGRQTLIEELRKAGGRALNTNAPGTQPSIEERVFSLPFDPEGDE